MSKQVTREQFNHAKRMDNARIWDGRPYMLYLDTDGATVWGLVEIIEPPNLTMLDYVMFGTKPPR